MIDIHNHILPALDDGPKDINESIEMAKKAVQSGITDVIATPHFIKDKYEINKERIFNETRNLNEALNEYNLPLKVWPGQEIRISDELLDDFRSNKVFGLNESSYILLELPSNHVPRYTERMIYDLQMEGIIPIIAHPERNLEIARTPQLLENLVLKGAYCQLTAGNIIGMSGWRIKRFSVFLIRSHLIHLIASDAHNTGKRGFELEKAYHFIERKFGKEKVNYFNENAKRLLINKKL